MLDEIRIAFERLVYGVPDELEIVRMNGLQVGIERRPNLAFDVAKQSIRLGGPVGLVGLDVRFPAAEMRQGLRGFEACLPFAQHGFHSLSRGDVGVDLEHALGVLEIR